MSNKSNPARNLLISIAFPVLGVIVIWVVMSYMEARAFNHVTGKDVSTLDAMFISLRVQEEAGE
jgi:hypothetical protein